MSNDSQHGNSKRLKENRISEKKFPAFPTLDRELIEAISKHQCLLQVSTSSNKQKVAKGKAWEDVLHYLKSRFPEIGQLNANVVDLRFNFKLLLKRVSRKLEKFLSAAESKSLTPRLVPDYVEKKVIECFPRILNHKNHLMEEVVRIALFSYPDFEGQALVNRLSKLQWSEDTIKNLKKSEPDRLVDLTDNAVDGILNDAESKPTEPSDQDYMLEYDSRTTNDVDDVVDSSEDDSNPLDNTSSHFADSHLPPPNTYKLMDSGETLLKKYNDLISQSGYNDSSYEIIDFDNQNCFQISEEDFDRMETDNFMIGSHNADMLLLAKVLSRQTYSDVDLYSEATEESTGMEMFCQIITSELNDCGLKVTGTVLRDKWKSALKLMRGGSSNLTCFSRKKDMGQFNLFWFILLTFPHLFCLFEIEQAESACKESEESDNRVNLLKSFEYTNWMTNTNIKYHKIAQLHRLLFDQSHYSAKEIIDMNKRNTSQTSHLRHPKPIKLPNKQEVIEMNRRLQTASVPPTVKSKKPRVNWRPTNTNVRAPWMISHKNAVPKPDSQNIKVYYNHKKVVTTVAYNNFLELMKNVDSLSKITAKDKKSSNVAKNDIEDSEVRQKRIYQKRKLKTVVENSPDSQADHLRISDDSAESNENNSEEKSEVSSRKTIVSNELVPMEILSNNNDTSAKESFVNSCDGATDNITVMSIPPGSDSVPNGSSECVPKQVCDGSIVNQSELIATPSTDAIPSSASVADHSRTENDSIDSLTQSVLSEQQYKDLWEILKMNNIDPQTVTILNPTDSQNIPQLTDTNLQTIFPSDANCSGGLITVNTSMVSTSEIPLTPSKECPKDLQGNNTVLQPFDTSVLEESAKDCNIDLRSYYSLIANSIDTSETCDSLSSDCNKSNSDMSLNTTKNTPLKQKKLVVLKASSLSPVKQNKKIINLNNRSPVKIASQDFVKILPKEAITKLSSSQPVNMNSSKKVVRRIVLKQKRKTIPINEFENKILRIQAKINSEVEKSNVSEHSLKKIIDNRVFNRKIGFEKPILKVGQSKKSSVPSTSQSTTDDVQVIEDSDEETVSEKGEISIKRKKTVTTLSSDDYNSSDEEFLAPKTKKIKISDAKALLKNDNSRVSIEHNPESFITKLRASGVTVVKNKRMSSLQKKIDTIEISTDEEESIETHLKKQRAILFRKLVETKLKKMKMKESEKMAMIKPINLENDFEEKYCNLSTEQQSEDDDVETVTNVKKVRPQKRKEHPDDDNMEASKLDEQTDFVKEIQNEKIVKINFKSKVKRKPTVNESEIEKPSIPIPGIVCPQNKDVDEQSVDEVNLKQENKKNIVANKNILKIKSIPQKEAILEVMKQHEIQKEELNKTNVAKNMKTQSEKEVASDLQTNEEIKIAKKVKIQPIVEKAVSAEQVEQFEVEKDEVQVKEKSKITKKVKKQSEKEAVSEQVKEIEIEVLAKEKTKVAKKVKKQSGKEPISEQVRQSEIEKEVQAKEKTKVAKKVKKQTEKEAISEQITQPEIEIEEQANKKPKIGKKVKIQSVAEKEVKQGKEELQAKGKTKMTKKLKIQSEKEIVSDLVRQPEIEKEKTKVTKKLKTVKENNTKTKTHPEDEKDSSDESGEEDDVKLCTLLKQNAPVVSKRKSVNSGENTKISKLNKMNKIDKESTIKEDANFQNNPSSNDRDVLNESPSSESPIKVKKKVSFQLLDDEDSDYSEKPSRKKKKLAQKKMPKKQVTKEVSILKKTVLYVDKEEIGFEMNVPKSPYDFEDSDMEKEEEIERTTNKWKRNTSYSSDLKNSKPNKGGVSENSNDYSKKSKGKSIDMKKTDSLTASKLSSKKKISNDIKNKRLPSMGKSLRKSSDTNSVDSSEEDDVPLSAVTKKR